MKKKIFLFFILILILIIFFNKKILTYFFVKNISFWTEYDAELVISEFDYIEGVLEISKIKLRNKDNFFYKNIFESNKIIIDFNYKSLFSNLVTINKLILIEPKIYFEIKNLDNNTNEKKYIDNLNLAKNSLKKEFPKIYPKKNKDKNFIISDLLIINSRAFIRYPNSKKNLKINLSEMSFVKVGNAAKKKGQNFLHFKDALKIILKDIFFRISDEDLRNFIKKTYKID